MHALSTHFLNPTCNYGIQVHCKATSYTKFLSQVFSVSFKDCSMGQHELGNKSKTAKEISLGVLTGPCHMSKHHPVMDFGGLAAVNLAQ